MGEKRGKKVLMDSKPQGDFTKRGKGEGKRTRR